MRRYAFIDVQNTASTAEQMLGIAIDWTKLADYLRYKRSCTEVLFYTGIDQGDTITATEFEALAKSTSCKVRSKVVIAYKNRDRVIGLKCPTCKADHVHTINMGYTKKSNCDVELSVDVIEKAGPDVEVLLFTADGDFEYLIREALKKGVKKVEVVSYAGKDIKAGMTVSRFSTKLRNLFKEEPTRVIYASLKDIKHAISKVVTTTP